MISKSKEIWIYWRKLNSSYAYANKDNITNEVRTIGTSDSAVSEMLSNAEEQGMLMGELVGASPNHSEWNTLLKNYWNSLSVDVQAVGKKLEVGFIYNIDSIDRSTYIEHINAHRKRTEKKSLTTDEDLANYFEEQVDKINKQYDESITKANLLSDPLSKQRAVKAAFDLKYKLIVEAEGQHFKLGYPINLEDYMLYRHCLVYSQVSNDISMSQASPNIRFYLHSEADIKAAKDAKVKLERSRITAFTKVAGDLKKVRKILIAMGKTQEVSSISDESDLFLLLEIESKEHTNEFVAMSTNKNLDTIATIEEYIWKGVLRRLPNTQVIVDGNDPATRYGDTLNDTISFFKGKDNASVVAELKNRFELQPK